MSLKHGILGLLTYGSMTGYELMKVFNDSLSFFWNAQTSQIYRDLDSIEKNGWVTSQLVQQDDKPNKKIFTLSDTGKKELVKWLDGHSPKKLMKIRDEMTMRVFFSSGCDKVKLVRELVEYKAMNQVFYDGLRKVESELDARVAYINRPEEKLYWLMAINRGVYTAEGNIKWVDECLNLIKKEQEV